MFTHYNTFTTPDDAIHQLASDFNLSDDALSYLKQLVEGLDEAADNQEEFDKELASQQNIIEDLESRVESLENDLMTAHDEIEELEDLLEEYDEFVTKYLEVYYDTN